MAIKFNPLTGLFDLINKKASKVNIVDAGAYYTGTEVETALQEIGGGTTLDDRYVNVTGDTMTGTLQIDVNTATDEALILKTTDDDTTKSIFEVHSSTGGVKNRILPGHIYTDRLWFGTQQDGAANGWDAYVAKRTSPASRIVFKGATTNNAFGFIISPTETVAGKRTNVFLWDRDVDNSGGVAASCGIDIAANGEGSFSCASFGLADANDILLKAAEAGVASAEIFRVSRGNSTQAGKLSIIGTTMNGLIIKAPASYTGNYLELQDSNAAVLAFVDASGNLNIDGDLTIQGDDLFMTTNTANYFLMADGTNYNPTSPADARTGLGLVAGGAGDIWVEKAGDTMTGQLLVDLGSDTEGIIIQGDASQSANLQAWQD
ncbi:MAG: hypothetical protein KAS32_08700, partial [Candidatus Peribacteraceae bacterium]|nr:hypothetical protein [Candidatus Peribacteraceae bacterium]